MRSKYLILCFGIVWSMFNACSDTIVDPSIPAVIPNFTEINIERNSYNTLSAVVKVQVENAAEAYIKFSYDTSLSRNSPSFPVIKNEVQIPLLGLLENKAYAIQIVAISSSKHETESDTITFISGNLPIFGFALGFAQHHSENNVLINYGTAGKIIEVDKLGIKQWEVSVPDSHFVYRAFRIDSIY